MIFLSILNEVINSFNLMKYKEDKNDKNNEIRTTNEEWELKKSKQNNKWITRNDE